jgi:spore coat polysaccharide biosynthesis protein SpsF
MTIGIIIQARMGSTRLRGKVLLKLDEQSMLWHVVSRCKKSNAEKVIVATSTDSQDDEIYSFCASNNIDCFRGSESNVLDRYYQCAKKNMIDIVIRITSDCPLVDEHVINRAIDFFQKNNYRYVSNCLYRTFPRGYDVEVFSFDALNEAWEKGTEPNHLEHINSYFFEQFSKEEIGQFKNELDYGKYRLTVDTREDFELMKKIFNMTNASRMDMGQIISFLNNHPELLKINDTVVQKELAVNKKIDHEIKNW